MAEKKATPTAAVAGPADPTTSADSVLLAHPIDGPEQFRPVYERAVRAGIAAAKGAGRDLGAPKTREEIRQGLRGYFLSQGDRLQWGRGETEAVLSHYGLMDGAPAREERTAENIESFVSILSQGPKGLQQILSLMESDTVDKQEMRRIYDEMAETSSRRLGPFAGWNLGAAALKEFVLTTRDFPVEPTANVRVPNPFFNPEALAEKQRVESLLGPGSFARKMFIDEAGGVQTFQHPFAVKLEAAGMHPMLAEFVAYDVADPLNWVGAKPLAVLAGAGAVGLGTAVVKNRKAIGGLLEMALHARNGRVVLRDADLVNVAKKARKDLQAVLGFEDQIAPKTVRRAAVRAQAQALKKKALAAGSQAEAVELDRRAELTGKLSKVLAGQDRTKTDKEALDVLAELDEGSRNKYLSLRLQAVGSRGELRRLQALYGSRWELPEGWFSRRQLEDEFWDHKAGKSVFVDGGLVTEYMRRPDKFVDERGWLDTDEARALRRALGAEDAKDTAVLDRFQGLAYVGRSPILRDLRRAREAMKGEMDPQWRRYFADEVVVRARPMRQVLQNTGVFEPFVKAREMAHVARETKLAELVGLFGGDGVNMDLGVLGQLHRGGLPFKVTKVPGVLRGQTRGRLARLWSAPDPAMRDLNDELVFSMGDDLHRKAINTERVEAGLAEITAAGPEAVALGQKGRLFLNELRSEAVQAGVLAPDQVVFGYLPRIRYSMKQGASLEEAIRRLELDVSRRGSREAAPFFAMLRNGELLPQETNFGVMMDRYVRSLYAHKYVHPVVDDIVRVLTDPNTSAGSADERLMALDWLTAQVGGRSRLQGSALASLRKGDALTRAVGEDIIDKIGGMGDPLLYHSSARWFSRAWSGLWMTFALGGRSGSALKNLTQSMIGLERLGWDLPVKDRKPYLLLAARDVATNTQMQERFAQSSLSYGWQKGWGEFLDQVAAHDAVSQLPARTRDGLLYFYRMADLTNRMHVYRATEIYAEQLFAAAQRGGVEWQGFARKMRPDDRAIYTKAMRDGDLQRARRVAAEAGVNDSQWLYHTANRPMGPGTKSELINTAADAMYLFYSWPMNFAEGIAHAGSTGALGKAGARAATGRLQGAGRFLLHLTALGIGVDVAGQIMPGNTDFDQWIFPDTPDWYRRLMRVPDNASSVFDGGRIPIPLEPLAGIGSPVAARSLQGLHTLAESVQEGFIDEEGGSLQERIWDERYPTRAALDEFFRSQPALYALLPAAQELAKVGGLETDAEYQSVVERILASMLRIKDSGSLEEPESLGKRAARAQGFPFSKKLEEEQ